MRPRPAEPAPSGARELFASRIETDPSGRSWLSGLLSAMPHGRRRLGALLEEPGSLVFTLAVRTAGGGLGALEYPVAPPRELLLWYVDHPEALSWPQDTQLSAASAKLRRALIQDDPPGARARAQDRARELAGIRSHLSREWWRFENVDSLDCVLMTDRLVVTVTAVGGGPLPPATPWYPERSQLVRNLEAARQLAGERAWGAVVISAAPLPEASDESVAKSLQRGAPHLDPAGRAQLRAAYLGNLTWDQAHAAVARA